MAATQYAPAGGVDIACDVQGPRDAPVVTLSHSLAAARGMWDEQVRALGHDYRVVRYDLRGHGESGVSAPPYDFAMLADDVVAVLDHLGIEQTHFVGLSIGGMIGQHLALRHPDRVARLALCSTTSRIPEEMRPNWDERVAAVQEQGMEGQVDGTIERWFNDTFVQQAPDTVERIRDMIRNTPVNGFIGCARAVQHLDVTDQLHRIPHQTLCMQGERDPGTTVEAAQTIAERIPNAHLRILPGVKHLGNVETPEAFNTALSGFLAGA